MNKPDSTNRNPDPDYLCAMREAAGLSQTALAYRLGVSRRMIQYYESPEDSEGHRPAPYLYQFALECLAV